MSLSESLRVEAQISTKALVNNYRAILEQVPGQSMLPMIKANAYGHGAGWAAKILSMEDSLYGLGVATLDEGVEIRKALENKRTKTKIVVVSGTTPFTREIGQLCERYYLTPTITREEDWSLFVREEFHKKIPYELKFNTGMNRLGMAPGFARQIARTLRGRPSFEHPSGVLSHLAMSEKPEERLSQNQRQAFVAIRSELSDALPSTLFHLANSGAIWNAKAWGLEGLTDVVRPGISLYGVPPWEGAPVRGLQSVMNLRAPVIATHRLKTGDRVGYGGTFQFDANAKDGFSEYVAVLGVGYADGFLRSQSGRGHVWLDGKMQPVIGIVSMDLSAVSCSSKTKVGDWADLLGPHIDPWTQARVAGTLPYELFTAVSARVGRKHS